MSQAVWVGVSYCGFDNGDLGQRNLRGDHVQEDRPRRDRPCTVTRSPVADRGNYQRDKTKRLAHLDAQGAPQTGPVPPTHHPQL